MMLGLSLALALDLTVLFTFWVPRDILLRFWINLVILSAIAWACLRVTWTVWRLNHPQAFRKVHVILSSGVYDKMKFIAQIALPAAGTLYFALAGIWGLPNADEVSGTVLAVDTFLGVLLGISSASYKASGAAYDGTMVIEPHEDGSSLRLQSVDLQALASKQEITFKVVQPPAA